MPDRSPTDLKRLIEFVDASWPGHCGAELVVWLPDRMKAVLPVRVYVRDADEETPALTDIESCVMQAVTEHAGECPLTGQKIADLSGYSFAGHFRSTLAGLVRKGLLANGGDGYSQASP